MAGSHASDVIPFDSGHAFPGILPDLTEPARTALTRYRDETLQYGERMGLGELRAWIAGWLKQDGHDLSADHVMVVNGAKHGIELICRKLLKPGDAVIVTAPTYFTVLPIFKACGAVFIEVGQDAEGIDVEEIEASLAWLKREGRNPPKLIYDIPEFHNPTGRSMSVARRESLAALAERHGILIVEDSPYREIRFEGDRLPSLQLLAGSNRVASVGTFSKLIAPGLRIGWIAASPALLDGLPQMKTDGGSSPLLQRIVLEFCDAGGLAEQTQRARQTYRRHRDRMVVAVRRELPDAMMQIPEGGYYLWLTLPGDVDGDLLAQRAMAEGVNVIPGSKFFAGQFVGYPRNQTTPKNNIRLAFSHAGPDEIDEGVSRLARAYAALRSP